MKANPSISNDWYVNSHPKDIRNSFIISWSALLFLALVLYLIKYTIPDPPIVAHLMMEEEALQDVEVEDLIIADGGSAMGGGTPSNDTRSDQMDQSEELLTDKGHDEMVNGRSNHSNGSDPNNPSSSPHKANNPFGDGGNGGGVGGGDGPFNGRGHGKGGEGDGDDDGYGDGTKRTRINNPVLPQYNTDVDLKIHLKLTVSGSGDVTNAVCIKSKTTTTDQTIINDVIRQVIRQVRYKKDAAGRPAFCFLTVTVNAR